ncbi:hypothetical protein OAJ35_04155 [Gammaproteobacteria bacterium]|nr:hypothetical protein [Gammaproteobacteria bacterium]
MDILKRVGDFYRLVKNRKYLEASKIENDLISLKDVCDKFDLDYKKAEKIYHEQGWKNINEDMGNWALKVGIPSKKSNKKNNGKKS